MARHLGRIGLVVVLAAASASVPAQRGDVADRWRPLAPITGTGADCARLLDAHTTAALLEAGDGRRGALVLDDGRLIPFAIGATAVAIPGLYAASAPGAPRLTLSGAWPDSDCRLSGWSVQRPAASSPVPADTLVELAHAASTGVAGAAALSARSQLWQRGAADVSARWGDTHPLARQVAATAALVAIEAGQVDADIGAIERGERDLAARYGPTSLPALQALDLLAAALMLLERDRDMLVLVDARLPAAVDALGASHRVVLRLQERRVQALSARGGGAALTAAADLLAATRALPADDPLRFEARLLHARAQYNAGRYEASVQELEPLAKELGAERSRRAARLLDYLASAYTAAGRLADGLLMQQRAYLAMRELAGPGHPLSIHAAHSYANHLRQLGDSEGAAVYAREAFDGYQARYGAGHNATVAAARGLSLALGENGRPAESLAVIEPQIEAAIGRLGADHRQTLNTMIHRGEILGLLGRHEEQVTSMRALLAPAERVFGPRGELTLITHMILAEGLVRTGQPAAARAQIAFVAGHLPGVRDERRAQAMAGALAATAEANGDLDLVESLLAQFVERAERSERAGLPDTTAATLQAWRSPSYLRLIALRAERGEVPAAFDLSERFKGRALLATLGELAGDASPALPAARRAELAELRQAYRAADAEVAAATSDIARIAAGERRDSAALAYRQKRAAARRDFTRFAAVADAPVLTAGDIARVLPADTCFMSFVIGAQKGGVFVVSRTQGVRYLPLPEPARIDAAVDRLRRSWSEVQMAEPPPAGPAAPSAAEDSTAALAALATGLAQARRACAPGARRLLVAPDASLALIPIDSIEIDGAPLGAGFTSVSYVQSLSVYSMLRERRASVPSGRQLLAVAPTFGAATAEQRSTLPVAARNAVLRGATPRLASDAGAGRRAFDALAMDWPALPGAEREARSVAALFPDHRLLRGDDASERRLAEMSEAGELSRYRYALFSTHGYLSLDQPALSALVLHQPGDERHDGYLTAAELPLYGFNSELIVLSACETGVGPVRSGSGVMGLPLALLIAGNHNAIVTLWKVPDDGAAEFTQRLFARLKAGQSPSAALAATKRDMATRGRHRAPRNWAGFVIYGVD